MRFAEHLAASCAALLLAGAAVADDGVTLESLAERVRALESEAQEDDPSATHEESPAAEASTGDEYAQVLADWLRRVRIGGSANAGYYVGGSGSFFDPGRFEVWDTRFFVDAELGGAVRLFDTTLIRNAGLSFEWDLVRLGELSNQVGNLYVDLQGLGDWSWANLQFGRFQIPVGEAYLRYGKGYAEKPFVSNVIGGPWWWDEGFKLYGSDEQERVGYVASITNGETPLNDSASGDLEYTLKVWARPNSWLYVSASGLYTGELGNSTTPALGGLWLGEAFAMPVGFGTPLPTFDHGVAVPPAPLEIERTWLVGGDVIIEPLRDVRLWLSYGFYDIEAEGSSRYDRSLQYWVAELILGGGLVHPELRDFYLGVRANGLGTYDDDRGYLLDGRQSDTLGFNTKKIDAYSVVLGWKILRFLTLRLEYTHQQIDVVRGATSAIRDAARHANYGAIEIGAHF